MEAAPWLQAKVALLRLVPVVACPSSALFLDQLVVVCLSTRRILLIPLHLLSPLLTSITMVVWVCLLTVKARPCIPTCLFQAVLPRRPLAAANSMASSMECAATFPLFLLQTL
jgi:hypothetical protein